MLRKSILAVMSAVAGTAVALTTSALAETATGQPVPWQMGLQPAASPVMADMAAFHNLLLIIITLITLFVLGLLIYVMIKFNAKANPTPSKTTHNTFVEVLWTVVPIVILVVIAIPSFKLLYFQNTVPEADITIKAIGHQWYWSYEYPDEGFTFDAFMLDDDSRAADQPRLLAVDNEIVLPIGKIVRVQVTADDVLHAFAVPALGVKVDTVPGKLTETWIQISDPGVFYGQCSELCGVGHAFMPIAVRGVTQAEYNDWVAQAREEFARIDPANSNVADAR